MNWSAWIRQIHRWLSIAFTLAVTANFIAVIRHACSLWIGLTALVPLALLLVTGLYMFVLPYALRWSGRREAQSN